MALKTPDGRYVSSAENSGVDLSGNVIGNKETFLFSDLNGGELAEGDGVVVKQVSTVESGETKVKGWKVKEGEIRRGASPDTFTLKKSDAQWVLQTSDGKFLGPVGEGNRLAPVDTIEAAVKFDVLDAPPVTPPSASPAAETPAAETPAVATPAVATPTPAAESTTE